MLCSKCKKNEATYYMERNINGKVTKLALCPECARDCDMSEFNMLPSFGGFNLLGGLFGAPVRTVGRQAEKRCTLCSSTFEEIVNNGKVGCAKCYEVFSDELEPTLRRIHGNVRHVGRRPAKQPQSKESKEDKLAPEAKKADKAPDAAALRSELNEAVAREDYENAAKLRDRLRTLENKGGNA